MEASCAQLERDATSSRTRCTATRVRPETSSLFRSLDRAPTRDRWDGMGENLLSPTPGCRRRCRPSTSGAPQTLQGQHERQGAAAGLPAGLHAPPRRDAGGAPRAGDSAGHADVPALAPAPRATTKTCCASCFCRSSSTAGSKARAAAAAGALRGLHALPGVALGQGAQPAGSGDFTGLLCPHASSPACRASTPSRPASTRSRRSRRGPAAARVCRQPLRLRGQPRASASCRSGRASTSV